MLYADIGRLFHLRYPDKTHSLFVVEIDPGCGEPPIYVVICVRNDMKTSLEMNLKG